MPPWTRALMYYVHDPESDVHTIVQIEEFYGVRIPSEDELLAEPL